MVDRVLKKAREGTGRVYADGLSLLIQGVDVDASWPMDGPRERACIACAVLKETYEVRIRHRDPGVGEESSFLRSSPDLLKKLRRVAFEVFR
jgi:hypothetical protein